MKYLVTLSDKNYVDKGLVLFESLSKFPTDFRLYYLCLDIKTHEILSKINDDRNTTITK